MIPKRRLLTISPTSHLNTGGQGYEAATGRLLPPTIAMVNKEARDVACWYYGVPESDSHIPSSEGSMNFKWFHPVHDYIVFSPFYPYSPSPLENCVTTTVHCSNPDAAVIFFLREAQGKEQQAEQQLQASTSAFFLDKTIQKRHMLHHITHVFLDQPDGFQLTQLNLSLSSLKSVMPNLHTINMVNKFPKFPGPEARYLIRMQGPQAYARGMMYLRFFSGRGREFNWTSWQDYKDSLIKVFRLEDRPAYYLEDSEDLKDLDLVVM